MNSGDTESNVSPREKPGTCTKPFRLTPSEVDSLRQEMNNAGEWMEAELKRRYPNGWKAPEKTL